jgi:hypothetical protein
VNLRLPIATCAGCVPPPSPYGTTDTYNKAALVFTAAAGEQNQVTVTESAKSGDLVNLQVIDAGAPLSPGPSCSGGGPSRGEGLCGHFSGKGT